MKTSVIAALLALAGCRQVFGLDSPDLEDRIDAPGPRVVGRYFARHLHNDADGDAVIDEYVFPTLQAEASLSDGRTTPITVQSDGSFSFPINTAGERYAVRFRAGTSAPIEYQEDAAELYLARFKFVHPDAVVAAVGTRLSYRVPDAAVMNTSVLVHSTGQWMFQTRDSG